MTNTVTVVRVGARGHQGSCTCGWLGKVRRRCLAMAVHDAHTHATDNPGHWPALPLQGAAS